jgi:hypothetical protein
VLLLQTPGEFRALLKQEPKSAENSIFVSGAVPSADAQLSASV